MATAMVVAAMAVTACGGGSGKSSGSASSSGSTTAAAATTAAATTTPATSNAAAGGWSEPNANLASTRVTTGPISSSNVSQLGVAWTVPITGAGAFGDYATTPVVDNGVVYTQDMGSNVYAIDLKSGKLLWRRAYNSLSQGPTGVNVADDMVFGATETKAFALSAKTGEQLWSRRLTANNATGIDMAPGINNGTVYISTNPCHGASCYAGQGQAVLYALDPKTGKVKWKWDEVPSGLWGNPKANSGGGQWQAPSFDAQGNLYVGVANPGPLADLKRAPWGQTRPGPDLYTDSIVKLNAKTGKVMWHYQLLPHDVYDWDLNNAPALTNVKVGGHPVLVAAGKAGIAFALNQDTGKLLWKRPLGKRNGIDNDNLAALHGHYGQLNKRLRKKLYPGIWGGVETQYAVDGATAYFPVNNLWVQYGVGKQGVAIQNPDQGNGEMDALDVGTGKIKWRHHFSSSPYGDATVVNDLVFTTTFDGTIWALNKDTGAVVWHAKLPAHTNAPLAIVGDTVLTAGSYPQSSKDKPEIVAYRLGATGATASSASGSSGGGAGSSGGGAGARGGSSSAMSLSAGKQQFAQTCSSCHTLSEANATGTVGPNLDQLKPSRALVTHQVTAGGGGMPAFGSTLSKAKIAAVAKYVSAVAGTGKNTLGGKSGPKSGGG